MNAQSFQELAAVHVNAPAADVRNAAMGGALELTSARADSVFDNPATAASSSSVVLSVGATRSAYAAEARSADHGLAPFRYHDPIASSALSHLTVAIPTGRIVVAAYFVEQPRLHSGNAIVSGNSDASYTPPSSFDGYLLSPQPGFDLTDRRYGATAAWRIGVLDLGAGAEVQQLDERTAISRTFLSGFNASSTDRLVRTISGRSVVPSVGIVWRVARGIAIGASYKGGGSFTRTSAACGIAGPTAQSCDTSVIELNRTRQRMPSTLRADLSLQASRALLMSLAAVRRDYSRFAHDPYAFAGGPFVLPYRDVIEKHAGAEYRIRGVALRAGWWQDPTHFRQPLFGAADFTRDVHHWTYGAAVNLGGVNVACAVDDGGKHGGRIATIGLSRSL